MTAPVVVNELLADPADLALLSGLPADDTRLLTALLSASRRFAGAVRHPVRYVEDDDILLDGHGTASLLLPAIPVVDVTIVEVDGVELADDEFEWSADGLIERTEVWPRRRRIVRVVYSHGYDPIPGDISAVVTEAAQMALNTDPGISTQSVGGMSVSYATTYGGSVSGATRAWADTIVKYRLNQGHRS